MPTLDRHGIPAAVLNGRDKRYIKVYNLYRARFTQELYRLLNASFWTRAEGNRDAVAGKWKKLRPITRTFWKPKDIELLSSYKLRRKFYDGDIRGKESVGLLSPEQRKQYNETYTRELGNRKSPEAKRLAAKVAWESIKSNGPEREYVSLINIRTGRLVASTAPGKVVNARYYAPADQVFNITPQRISISLKQIPYADAVDAVRPIIPDNIDPWVEQAHEAIIREVKILYDAIKKNLARNPSKIKGRSNSSPSKSGQPYPRYRKE